MNKEQITTDKLFAAKMAILRKAREQHNKGATDFRERYTAKLAYIQALNEATSAAFAAVNEEMEWETLQEQIINGELG